MQTAFSAVAAVLLLAVIALQLMLLAKMRDAKASLDEAESARESAAVKMDGIEKTLEGASAKIEDLEETVDDKSVRLSDEIRSSSRAVEETIGKAANWNDSRMESRISALASSSEAARSETSDRIGKGFAMMRDETGKSLSEMTSLLSQTLKAEAESRAGISEVLSENLARIGKATEDKLSEIRRDVSDKLDSSLNRRLDESFEKVSSQLSLLYRSLGELGEMSSGISTLNRTLSNVKNRGTWGEIRLGSVIEDVLAPSQYERNVRTVPKSQDVVEYAVKIPARDSSSDFVYLPIDSKFPSDAYSAVLAASEAGDAEGRKTALKELERRILEEAKKISGKYVNPPVTTDFAVMFLPSESLYAEVMSIDGLAQRCQVERRVLIASPSTTAALLNSLQVGFAAVAVSRKTAEVRNLLAAVKAQYEKFDDLAEKMRKQIETASRSADELKKRTEIIRKKLSSAEDMSPEDSDRLLIEDAAPSAALPSAVPAYSGAGSVPPLPGARN